MPSQMKNLKTFAVTMILATLATGRTRSLGQSPAAPTPVPVSQLPPPSTPLGSGPHKAILEVEPTLPTHTIYHPKDLSAFGAEKLPVVVWANGACLNVGNRFRFFLTDIASYGYVVIAIGPIVPGQEAVPMPAPPPAPPAPPAAGPPPQIPSGAAAPTHSVQLIDGLNWAIAESRKPDSKYFGKLDVEHVAVIGQSCGGVQTIEAAADPRFTTAVIWDSGLFPKPTGMGGGKPMSRDEDLKKLHLPMAYITGDPQDIAFDNANGDFKLLEGIPVFRGWERGVPHMGTYRDPNGGEFAGVAEAWLNWRLKGDARSALMFQGKDCGLCVNPKWVVEKKNIDR